MTLCVDKILGKLLEICCMRSKFEFDNRNSIFREKWRTIDVLGIWTNLLKVEVYEISFVNQKLDLVNFWIWFPKVFKYSYIHTLLHDFDPNSVRVGIFYSRKIHLRGKVFTINFHLKGHILKSFILPSKTKIQHSQKKIQTLLRNLCKFSNFCQIDIIA